MTFQQQMTAIQAMIKQYATHVPATRKMGSYEVHDLYFNINGISIYCCVNYTSNTVTWRNKNTGEEVCI